MLKPEELLNSQDYFTSTNHTAGNGEEKVNLFQIINLFFYLLAEATRQIRLKA